MSTDDRPSIAELQRLDQEGGAKQHRMAVEHGATLLEIAAAALAWQAAVGARCNYGSVTYENQPSDITSPEFRFEAGKLDAVADGLLREFLDALAKVRR